MENPDFDGLFAKLIEKCKITESTEENSTSRSKIHLEIESVIRNIDKQIEYCKFLISETLRLYESKLIAIGDLQKNRLNIEIEEASWDEFEAMMNSRINEFLKVRKNYLDLVNVQEISNQKNQEFCENYEKIVLEINQEKNHIFDEISKVDKTIESLNYQILGTKNRIDFFQMENTVFRDCLKMEENKWRQRADETEEKLQKFFILPNRPEST
ncbi:uncharacterized protein [Venturia canescens]|uniref:uncharacterized protein n=1 Tax=Venturia canescens TaxID=32260 RepID=UPI001C9C19D5|nr:uncharacterized protein LOC122418528 [Venturia canescens]